MAENQSAENTSTSGAKSYRGNFGRGGIIALTAILALIIGFFLGWHIHRHHFEERRAWGGGPMMMRGGFCQPDMGDGGMGRMGGMSPMAMGQGRDMGTRNGRMGMHPGMGMGPGMKGARPGMMGMWQGSDPAARAERMQQALGLTDPQTQQIESALADEQARMQATMRSIDSLRGASWRAGHSQIHSQISAILTPAERTKWEKLMAGRMAHQ